MEKKSNIFIKFLIFIGILQLTVSATDFDPDYWQCLCGVSNIALQYIINNVPNVQYNPDDGCFYMPITPDFNDGYNTANRYNSTDYTIDTYEVTNVNQLTYSFSPDLYHYMGEYSSFENLSPYLPEGCHYVFWKTSDVANTSHVAVIYGGNNIDIPGTHAFIPELTINDMYYLNGALKEVLNVKKDGQLIASAYLIIGRGDSNKYNKLAVFADGFDPGNRRKLQHLTTLDDFKGLANLDVAEDNYSPVAHGYDLVFVDFIHGAGDIRDNAKAYLKILETLCEKAGSNRVVAGGFSMGGVISRLALLYGQKLFDGEPCADISNVYKYIACDSPQQGAAGLPTSLQSLVKDKKPEHYSSINNPAARQMLYRHIESLPSDRAYDHDRFYSYLKDLGNYPVGMKLYSIANSNWNIPYNGDPYSVYWRAVWLDFVQVEEVSITFSDHDLAPGSSLSGITPMLVPEEIANSADETFRGYGPLFGPLAQFTTVLEYNCDLYYNNELRHPTHMPIYSVFDLKNDTPESLKNANSLKQLCAGEWTPFDKIYLCPEREIHITFNKPLLKNLLDALNDGNDITPILQLLLD